MSPPGRYHPPVTRNKIVWLLSVLVGPAVLYVLLAPSPIDAVAYTPEPGRPLDGVLAPDEALRSAELLARSHVLGPEDVAVDPYGRIYGGQADGHIARLSADGETVEDFADTGGRPLGLAWSDPALRTFPLLVADAVQGLLSIGSGGEITTLSTEAGSVPFGFTDDLDVGPDGTVYFSDASSVHGVDDYLYDLLEARPYGRLLAFDPATSATTVLLDGLYFANGVAVSPQGDFVLVNETYRYRIRRYWLTGPRAGTSEIFLDRLPGYADGISSNGTGTFWVAMFTVRNPLVEKRFHPRPFWKERLALLPRFLWPKPEPYGLVLGVDRDGEIVEALHDPGGERVSEITSVEEVQGSLYLGTLHGDWIGRLPTP